MICRPEYPPASLQSGGESETRRRTRHSDSGRCGTEAFDRDGAQLMPDGVAAAGTSCGSCVARSGHLRCLCQAGSADVLASCRALANRCGCCCPVDAAWLGSQPSASADHDDRARHNTHPRHFVELPWLHRDYPVLAAKGYGTSVFGLPLPEVAWQTDREKRRPGVSSPRRSARQHAGPGAG